MITAEQVLTETFPHERIVVSSTVSMEIDAGSKGLSLFSKWQEIQMIETNNFYFFDTRGTPSILREMPYLAILLIVIPGFILVDSFFMLINQSFIVGSFGILMVLFIMYYVHEMFYSRISILSIRKSWIVGNYRKGNLLDLSIDPGEEKPFMFYLYNVIPDNSNPSLSLVEKMMKFLSSMYRPSKVYPLEKLPLHVLVSLGS